MPRSVAVVLLVLVVGLIVVVAPRGSDVSSTPAPTGRPGTSAPAVARPTSTAVPSATADALVAVPPACRASVRGEAFADGSVSQRAGSAQQWMDAHRGQVASVVVTDDIVTDAAVRGSQGQPVRDVRVAIEPTGFRMSATAVFIGTFPIRALLAPSAVNGALRMEVRELDTDGMPGFFRGSVENSIAAAADPSAWGIRMRVQGVATAAGCAVVWGTA